MNQLTCYIIDELTAIRQITKNLKQFPAIKIIGSTERVKTGLDFFLNNEYPDILFLDMELEDIDVLQNQEPLIRQQTILILTGVREQKFNDEYVGRYLRKPIDPLKFSTVISTATERVKRMVMTDCCLIPTNIKGMRLRIAYDEINRLEAVSNYVKICFTNRPPSVIHYTLKAAELQLPEQFVRVSKSAIANINSIKFITANSLILLDNHELKLGSQYRKDLLDKMPLLG